MKYSYKWLKELSGTTKSPQEVAEMLITHSFEVEEIIEQGEGLAKVVIGEVLTKEKHPDADKLNVATVRVKSEKGKVESDSKTPLNPPLGKGEDTQEQGVLTIVCGAPNLEVGQKVPVALMGAVLPTADGKGFTIAKSDIRGVESNGMICAEDELGLGEDHEGIMVLAEDAPVGESFVTYQGLDDTILDIDVLPNRAHDALGHWGMAREIAALEGRVLDECPHPNPLPEGEGGIKVSIDTKTCLRYAALSFDNVTIAPSPGWMQSRLAACDITPINNIVDITNYIMLEYGQPTHAFSSEKLKVESEKCEINVRQAQANEKVILLNDEKLHLHTEDIVITDGTSPIALAGVMGGQGSAITEDSKNVIFEIANFDASTIRKTSARHSLDTDAAYRFERDLDPNLVDAAITKIVTLMKEMLETEVTYGVDVYPTKQEPWEVLLPHVSVKHLLGIAMTEEKVESILTALGITVTKKDGIYICAIPTIRRDLHDVADLIEEIGRVYGYDKITATALQEAIQPAVKNEQRMFERSSKDFFVGEGFDEVKAYSFYSSDDAKGFGIDDERHIVLLNPMSSEQALMRQTLAAGLLRASVKNSSYEDQSQLFEIGRIYAAAADGLPVEQVRLAASVTSKEHHAEQFFVLKGYIEDYLEGMGVSDVYFDDVFGTDDADVMDLHPSRRALIKTADGDVLGFIGEAAKKTMKYFGIKKMRTAVCELHLARVQKCVQDEKLFAPLAKFPSVSRDLSMIVGSRTRVADVERVLYGAGGELLQDVDLFDLYINNETQERSMAFHFTFADPERTLTAKEVDVAITQMITAVEEDGKIEVKK